MICPALVVLAAETPEVGIDGFADVDLVFAAACGFDLAASEGLWRAVE